MRAHHTRSKIDDIRKKMSGLPELKADEIYLNNKESISILVGDIEILRKRRYGFEWIVEFFREHGLDVENIPKRTKS